MKKNKIILFFIIIAILGGVLSACSNPRQDGSIDFAPLEDGLSVQWYNQEPAIPDTNLSWCFVIYYQDNAENEQEKEPIAVLTGFSTISEDGHPLLDRTSSENQTLKFTLISSYEGEEQPNIILKVNGEVLVPKTVEIRTTVYNEYWSDTTWCFDYENEAYPAGVILSFERLIPPTAD